MSSSSSTATDPHSSLMSSSTILPTTTTFLPILDDLLSPDFRPVSYPPLITPLQTPTTNCAPPPPYNSSNNNSSIISSGGGSGRGNNVNFKDGSGSSSGGIIGSNNNKEEDKGEAALKIQKWWKKSNCRTNDGGGDEGDGEDEDSERVEDAKHSIRHKRAEDHIRHLESELSRMKSTLSAERKLRSLQYEAIRSLWSQVQKLSVNNPDPVMTQSCPNGLPPVQAPVPLQAPSSSLIQNSCPCSSEIKELKQKIESEVGELRSLVSLLLNDDKQKQHQQQQQQQPTSDNDNDEAEEEVKAAAAASKKRPDTLDLSNNGGGGGNKAQPGATGEELAGYADDMAKYVVERGLSDNDSNSKVGDNANESK